MDLENLIPLQGSKGTCKTEGDSYMWSQIDTWFVNAGRSSRWMDLLGDYAGMELFVIDGQYIHLRDCNGLYVSDWRLIY